MASTANPYINIYFKKGTDSNSEGAITETPDLANDEFLSSDSERSNPLTVTINSSTGEAQYRKCGIRTQTGFKTTGDTVISFAGGNPIGEGDNAPKTNLCWRIAKTREELAGSSLTNQNITTDTTTLTSLTISEPIVSTANTLFYIMVLATENESPTVDTSVSIVTTATIAAEEENNG